MKLDFNIQYDTAFGEELMLNVISSGRDECLKTVAYRMTTADGRRWTCCIGNYHAGSKPVMEYFYSLNGGGRELRREWTTLPHRVEFTALEASTYEMNDRWSDIPEDSYLYSSAFTGCVNRRRCSTVPVNRFASTVRFVVRAPQLRGFERLAIVGSNACLGEWNVAKAVEMTEHSPNEWLVDIDAKAFADTGTEYKFIALNDNDANAVKWETGYNRTLKPLQAEPGKVVIEGCDQAFFEICDVKLAGTLIPVFSLRSDRSFGVGDFGDVKRMVDWLADTRQRVLQLLPVNDTTATNTWRDSYPYNCISVFALHPMYADLNQLPPIDDPKKRVEYEALRQELNALPQLDYEKVNRAKLGYLRILFAQEGGKTLRSAAFKRFFADAERWLVPYAQYCRLRDTYGTVDFSCWKGFEQWRESDRAKLLSPRGKDYNELAFYFYVQFILDKQLSAAHDYAVARGVILKGDIPIGVCRRGCDVWQEPEYFNLEAQAGAPPDDFAKDGQNWSFPTYNWERMMADGCLWWIRRFKNMSKFFDAYRIDHILGFFRIWEIPASDVNALAGQFSPALAMSREEIEAYGLHFSERLFTEPFVTEAVVDSVFGDSAERVKDSFLNHSHSDVYRLKPEYDTQRKIEKAFIGATDAADVFVRDGLYRLVSGVLFVRDRTCTDKYHPRICAHSEYVYQSLGASDRQAFDRLYDDYFYRRNSHFWYREAMRKLPLLVESTRMLTCAEDLGMVPECVPWVMNKLRILSLELQSMPKACGLRFGKLRDNPYRSVCTISTHDTPTLRQWWDEVPQRTQDYFSSILHYSGQAPHPIPGWLARDVVVRHLSCPSMLCVLSLQDWLSTDEHLRNPDMDVERINIPANPDHYWRWRMHITIEQLQSEKRFNDMVAEMIAHSGRR